MTKNTNRSMLATMLLASYYVTSVIGCATTSVDDNLFDSETYSGIEKRNELQNLIHRPKYFF
jgi:hypothetical protein